MKMLKKLGIRTGNLMIKTGTTITSSGTSLKERCMKTLEENQDTSEANRVIIRCAAETTRLSKALQGQEYADLKEVAVRANLRMAQMNLSKADLNNRKVKKALQVLGLTSAQETQPSPMAEPSPA